MLHIKEMKMSNYNEFNLELININNIDDFTVDSREVTDNMAFFAIKGNQINGENFIEQAIKNGAKYIIAENIKPELIAKYANIKFFKSTDVRGDYALFAKSFYKILPEHLIAVTATNGKSSIVNFLQQILVANSKKAATIGTIGIAGSESKTNSKLSTPDAKEFYYQLSRFKKEQINYAAFEATSIGLDQKRIYGAEFEVAIFSNFSQDHLDYHGDMQHYLESKLKIFDQLADKSLALINHDMLAAEKVIEYLNYKNIKFISYGHNADTDFKISDIKLNNNGQEFTLNYNNKAEIFKLPLVGKFQIDNIVPCIIAAEYLGCEISKIKKALETIQPALGRMERVIKNKHIYIDFAHTADALLNAAKALAPFKEIANGKLYILFGAGGDRDKSKRPLMAQAAAKYADYIIITDDNPRTEEPAQIRADIEQGLNEIDIDYINYQGSRAEAINYALQQVSENDILLIAGKGHETYQEINNQRFSFDEREIINNFYK